MRTADDRRPPARATPPARAGFALALLVTLGLGAAGARADESEKPPVPPPAPPPVETPGAKPTRRLVQALDTVQKHAVMVSFRYQKDLEAEEHAAIAPDSDAPSEAYRFWRMSMRAPGFVIKDKRTVIISDLFTPLGAIASVEVLLPGREPVRARLRGFLANAEALIVEAESDLAVEPVNFPTGEDAPAEGLVAGSITEGAHGLEAWVDGLGALRRRVGGTKLAHGMPDSPTRGLDNDGGARSVDLVMAPGGIPVGFRFGGGLDIEDGVWRGKDVLADAEVPFASLKERESAWAKRSTRARIEVVLRTTKRDDRDESSFGGSSDGDDKQEHWGFAVAPDLLVVTGRLEPDAVRRLESLRWKVDDGPGTPAAYLGKVRGLDAYVVRVEGASFEPLPAEQASVPPIGAAVLVHTTTWRGGARRDQVDMNRVLGRGRRYGDNLDLALERPVTEGALLLDLDGRVFGVAMHLDPEDKEEQLTSANPFSRRERRTYPLKAILFSELGLPATLAQDPDTRVMPQEETEAKRLPWLGVEATGFRKEVAELLDICAATRDGQRGLLVGRVYEGSPASRAGVLVGDILLSAKRTSGPGSDAPPVDLAETADRSRWFNPWDMMDVGDEAPAPWRSQDSALNRLLKTWGPDTAFELQYLRGKELKTASLKVEISPPSHESAPRTRDEGTGLTARDMTFEVRAALRLAKDAPGVVVARVEPGSPAAQARIAKNEILQELEGAPVPDAAALSQLLEAFRSQGRDSVRVVVRRLDKTRLVDLRLAPTEDASAETPPEER